MKFVQIATCAIFALTAQTGCNAKKQPATTVPAANQIAGATNLPSTPTIPSIIGIKAHILPEGPLFVGQTLKCDSTFESPSPVPMQLTYRWLVAANAEEEFVPIGDAFGSEFTVRSAEAHKTMRCEISAANSAQLSVSATSGSANVSDSHPKSLNASFEGLEDTPLTIALALGTHVLDTDADIITDISTENVSNGTLGDEWDCSSGLSCTNTFTPFSNFSGETSFRYKATNAYASSAEFGTVKIRVLSRNDPPKLAKIPQIHGHRNGELVFELEGSDTDENDILVYSCVLNCPTGLSVTGRRVSWIPTTAQLGIFTPTFEVQDGAGAKAQELATIAITNRLPENILATISSPTLKVGDIAKCVASATDPDDDSLAYAYIWQHSNTGGEGTFVNDASTGWNSNSLVIERANHAHKFVRCVASANDGFGGVVSANSAVSMVEDSLPTGSNFTESTAEDSPILISIGNSSGYHDADGDIINDVIILSVNNGAFDKNVSWQCNASTCTRPFIPSPNFYGTSAFQFVTINAFGKQEIASTGTVNVSPVNDAPVMSSISGTQNGLTGSLISLELSANDVDYGDVLTFSCSAACPAGLTVKDSFVNWTPTGSQIGFFDVTFRATDLHGSFDEKVVRFNIIDNTPPAIPVLSSTTPTSPSGSREFTINALVETESTVNLYNNENCAGSPIQQKSGIAANARGFSIQFGITEIRAVYSANAADAANNISGCSIPIAYERYPERLAIFDSAEASSTPRDFVSKGDIVYFTADDGFTGIELWKTDGTTAGTTLVKDINTNGSSAPSNLVILNGTLFFTATTTSAGTELWRSDGTTAGTWMVKDLYTGTQSSSPSNLTVFNNKLVFTATTQTTGSEIFTSDGTEEGTLLLKDIRLGTSGTTFASPFVVHKGALYFAANNYTNGDELWRTDGTTAGTFLVKDIVPGTTSSTPSKFVSNGVYLFFTASTPSTGTELWKTDGTSSGTTLVKELAPGTNSSSPSNLIAVNNTIFFTANDAINGVELWKSNGSPDDTILVKDIYSGSNGSNPLELTSFNGTLIFTATDGLHGKEIWVSDGSETGTLILKDIFADATGSNPSRLRATPWGVFFAAASTSTSREMWFTDGTSLNTYRVGNYSGSTDPTAVAALSNKVVFGAATDNELYWATAAANSSKLLKNIRGRGTTQDSTSTAEMNGMMIFSATTLASGSELWKTDGTASGTTILFDIYSGALSSDPSNLTLCNNLIYFVATNATTGRELWKTNGTQAGTILVKDIRSGSASSNPTALACFNNEIYFQASDGTKGAELWKSNGTATGTTLVSDILGGSGSSFPTGLTEAGGNLYFAASTSANGIELWKTDGTATGTVMVKDINPGSSSSTPTLMQNVNEKLMFVATNATTGAELWISDGSASGTQIVKDIRPGNSSAGILGPTVMNGTLYFQANNGTSGSELWRSDGTSSGTVMVQDLATGSAGSAPTNLVAMGGTLYFSGTASVAIGQELYFTNGNTIALVKDIASGPTSGSPTWTTSAGDSLIFFAADGTNGPDIWTTKGTQETTTRVFDNRKQLISSTTSKPMFRRLGNFLYFFTWSQSDYAPSLWRL